MDRFVVVFSSFSPLFTMSECASYLLACIDAKLLPQSVTSSGTQTFQMRWTDELRERVPLERSNHFVS